MTASEMPDEIWIEPKPATWGAVLFSGIDPKNKTAIRYVRANLAIDKAHHEAALAELRECVKALKNIEWRQKERVDAIKDSDPGAIVDVSSLIIAREALTAANKVLGV